MATPRRSALNSLDNRMYQDLFPEQKELQDQYNRASQAALAKFTHKPLPSEDGHIRLLELHHGKPREPLRGILRTVALEEQRQYEALSYVWEDYATPRTIFLGGGQVSITESLYQALIHLRQTDCTRVLWVDALCINQADLDEKAAQVGLMNRIFPKATCVLCWLGADERWITSFELIVNIGRANFSNLPNRTIDDHFLRQHDLPLLPYGAWDRLMQFFRIKWFKRIWVYQEFISAKRAVFVCGNKEFETNSGLDKGIELLVEYNLMDRAASSREDYNLETVQSEVAAAIGGSVALRLMCQTRAGGNLSDFIVSNLRSFVIRDESAQRELTQGSFTSVLPNAQFLTQFLRNGGVNSDLVLENEFMTPIMDSVFNLLGTNTEIPRSLLMLLTLFTGGQASDPRDKLYALLGLSSERNVPALRPNYREPVETTYRRFTRYLMENSGEQFTAMSVLLRAGLTSRVESSLKLPTWMWDFSSDPTTLIPSTTQKGMPMMPSSIALCFHAAGTTKASVRLDDDEENLLYVKGLGVGEIVDVLPLPTHPSLGKLDDSADNYITVLYDFFKKLDKFVASDEDLDHKIPLFVPGGETMEEVIWRTLIGNLEIRPFIADTSLGDDYRALRECVTCVAEDRESDADIPRGMAALGSDWMKRFALNGMTNQLARLDSGHFALIPLQAAVGDEIHILFGGMYPFCLREVQGLDRERYQLVGTSYVHGIMQGELLETRIWEEEEVCLM